MFASLLASTILIALPAAGIAAEQGPQVWADGLEHQFDGDRFTSSDGQKKPVIEISGAGTKFTGNDVVIENQTTDSEMTLYEGLRVNNGASFELSGKSVITVAQGAGINMTGAAQGVIHGGTTINVMYADDGYMLNGTGIWLDDQSRLELNGAAGNEITINLGTDFPGVGGLVVGQDSEVTGRYLRINGLGSGTGIALQQGRVNLDHLTIVGVGNGIALSGESTAILSNVYIDAESIALSATYDSHMTVTNGVIHSSFWGAYIGSDSTVTLRNTQISAKGIGSLIWDSGQLNLADGSVLVSEEDAGIVFVKMGVSDQDRNKVTLSGGSKIEATDGFAVQIGRGSAAGTTGLGRVELDGGSFMRGEKGLYEVALGESHLTIIADHGSLLHGRGRLWDQATADVTLQNDSRWIIDGNSSVTNLTNNGSVIEFAENRFEKNQNGFVNLVIDGDYHGNNGMIIFNADLAVIGTDKAHDHILIKGDVYGSTNISVRNRNCIDDEIDSIELITINGHPENGSDSFILARDYTVNGQDAVVVGAYTYYLDFYDDKTTDGSYKWKLRAIYEDPPAPVDPENPSDPDGGGNSGRRVYSAGVPLYEAYPHVLQQMNRFSTLQQRVGERVFAGGENGVDGTGFWMRVEGATGHFNPARSLSGARYNLDSVRTQMGLDADLLETSKGLLVGGIYVQYGHGKAEVSSRYGSGDIKTDAYGVGGTLTWYQDNGFYVDAQAQVQWFNSSLYSRSRGGERGFDKYLVSGNHGLGYGFSLEGGRRFELSNGWSVTPQAQLVYSHVSFDSFYDMVDVRVRNGAGGSLEGRIGVGVERETSWRSVKGDQRGLKFYGIGNVYHEFLDGTSVSVAGKTFRHKDARTSVGFGGGLEYNWENGKYAVSGDVSARTPFDDFANSYEVKGSVGFQVRF